MTWPNEEMLIPSARELLENVFTVETIMTPREALLTWEQGDDLTAVLDRSGQLRYDVIPVTENGHITRVLCTASGQTEPLTSTWLVSRDTNIPDLLGLLLQTQRPGLLVFYRQDVIGIVTPADLNKLAARFYLYGLLGDIEMALSERVRTVVQDDTEIIALLSENRQAGVQSALADLKQANLDVDVVQLLTLADLFNVIEKHVALRESLGFASKSQAEKAFSGLNDLRNQTMHTNRTILTQFPEDLEKLKSRLDRAEELWERLCK